MTRFFAGFALLLALPTVAAAQSVDPNSITIAAFDPENAVAPISAVEGPGIKVGEGTVLHPVFGAETGLVSNVFYTDTNTQGAGLLRLIAQIGTGSLSVDRLAPPTDGPENKGSFQYRADLRASYDLMLSSNDTVVSTGGLGLGANIRGLANPMGRLSFGFENDFVRLIRAANFETDANTNRDINNLNLKLLYHPLEHSISGYLYYNNRIDVFEQSAQQFADRMFNQIGIHPAWQWLPQTQIYADVSQGLVSPIGSSVNGVPAKVSSLPFSAVAGIATLFTVRTTFNLYAGYANGFYSSGPSYSAPQLGAALGYRYSPLGRVTLLYAWLYQDSINANFYRDHVVQLSLQQLVAPFVLMVQPEVHFREYNGVDIVVGQPVRNDVIAAVVAGMSYNFRNWIAATLNYRFSTDQTDYKYMPIGGGSITDPSYVRHELLLGMRVAL